MTSTIAKVVRKKDHRDRYIGSLFRTSEPVTMIPDRHMRRPEIVEKIRKAMSVVTHHSQDDSVWQWGEGGCAS